MHERAKHWFRRRSSTVDDWPLPRLLAAKAAGGCRISVVIPAHDEAGTVADVVATLRRTLIEQTPLVDELVVIDSDSTDQTAVVAAAAGAEVYRAADIVPEYGHQRGKGEALWKSLFVTRGDLVVFVDADLTVWGPHFVTGLLGPLLTDPTVQLVRASYTRMRRAADGSSSPDGGRLTELVARPLLSLYWPELTGVVQPLAGEWAARRALMESLPVPVGYGVELSTLIDTAAAHGLDAIAQVRLGARGHRHRPDRDMAVAAAELLAVVESRRHPGAVVEPWLQQFEVADDASPRPVARAVPVAQRPPVAALVRA